MRVAKKVNAVIMRNEPSAYYFYMKIKISVDIQICISVPSETSLNLVSL